MSQYARENYPCHNDVDIYYAYCLDRYIISMLLDNSMTRTDYHQNFRKAMKSETLELVTLEKLQQIKNYLSNISCVALKIEMMENIFSLCLLTLEDVNDFFLLEGESDDEVDRLNRRGSDHVSTKLSKNNEKSPIGLKKNGNMQVPCENGDEFKNTNGNNLLTNFEHQSSSPLVKQNEMFKSKPTDKSTKHLSQKAPESCEIKGAKLSLLLPNHQQKFLMSCNHLFALLNLLKECLWDLTNLSLEDANKLSMICHHAALVCVNLINDALWRFSLMNLLSQGNVIFFILLFSIA